MKSKKLAGVLLLSLIIAYFLRSHELKKEVYLLETAGSILQLNLEIAKNISDIKKGLSKREYLAKNDGMLFVFSKPKMLRFWMKDTAIPLDLLYLDKNMVVQEIHPHLKPYSEKIIESRHPYSYALEMNTGFAEYHNIQIGDKLSKINN